MNHHIYQEKVKLIEQIIDRYQDVFPLIAKDRDYLIDQFVINSDSNKSRSPSHRNCKQIQPNKQQNELQQNDQKKLKPEQYIRMWFDSELGCLLDKYDNVYEYNSGQIKWLGKKYDLFG